LKSGPWTVAESDFNRMLTMISGLLKCGLNWYLFHMSVIPISAPFDNAQFEDGKIGEKVVFSVGDLLT
jgi:hypothetical protein